MIAYDKLARILQKRTHGIFQLTKNLRIRSELIWPVSNFFYNLRPLYHLLQYEKSILPHNAFICFLLFLQEVAIISLNSINCEVFVMEAHSVLCEVRTEFLMKCTRILPV